ncbi:hypothetical protein ANO11243_036310 [Dothideomycetidae sp. 11243]|nr:hypothetical protein ANO11243_036310 [fungal sp. No.11243]
MVTFEDDEDPAAGSGEDSQDEDETMEDADDGDADADATMVDDEQGEEQGDEDDNGEDNDDDEDDNDENESPSQSRRASRQSPRAPNPTVLFTSPSPRPTSSSRPAVVAHYIPPPRPESLTAVTYDIVPTMAAPQGTSINAVAATPDMRWVFSGGGDGYVRMYNWVETANGKVPLTVAQKHPFVDSVMKAGSLTTYWENEEVSTRTPPAQSAEEAKETSPVYSLAVQHQAIWLLSGLESGAINIQTCRHQAGSRIATLREHTSAVSVLKLALAEDSCLSGSWDKRILDWDLNTGKIKRTFAGSGAQISAIEMRPLSSLPVPKIEDVKPGSDTFSSNNAQAPTTNGVTNGTPSLSRQESGKGDEDALGSPDGSLFGENDHGSLFGEGDDGSAVGGGGGGFGDDDDEFGKAMASELQGSEGDGTQDATTQPTTNGESAETQDVVPPQTQPDSGADTGTTVPQDLDTSMAEAIGEQTQDPTFSQQGLDVSKEDEDHPKLNGAPEPSENASAGPSNLPHSEEAPAAGSLSTVDTSPTSESESVFLDAAIDGTIRLWDRRMPAPVARIVPQRGTPPWCMGACWSPDGNTFYAGRRNGTVDEYSLHRGSGMAEPVRTLRFPAGSGAVSAVRAMPNGRGLICASFDILRLYDLRAEHIPSKHSTVPFLIVPGHRTGVISALHIDPTCRFMISTAGNRGWEGSNTEVLLGYEIGIPSTVV